MANLEAEIDHCTAKAQKINDDGDHPKATQYESSAHEVILEAASIYHILIFTEDDFPEPSKQIEFIKRAWTITNENSALLPLALDPNIVKIVRFFNLPYVLSLIVYLDQGLQLSGLWRGQNKGRRPC